MPGGSAIATAFIGRLKQKARDDAEEQDRYTAAKELFDFVNGELKESPSEVIYLKSLCI